MNRSYTEYLKLKHRLKTRWKRWRRRDSRRRSKQLLVSTQKEGEEEHAGSGSIDIDHVIIAGGEEEVGVLSLFLHILYFYN